MALLELKVKQDKEAPKPKKFKRKRDVFGKRLSRIGIFVLIAVELIAFAVVKIFVTKQQNDRQTAIEKEIAQIKADSNRYTALLKTSDESYIDIGNLIATLPTSFDRQATNLDIDRMISLCGLTEHPDVTRTYDENVSIPFETKTTTLKAVKIEFSVIGDVDDIDAITEFIDYLADYNHENFYYVSSLVYSESRSGNVRSTCSFEVYTFYNDVTFS